MHVMSTKTVVFSYSGGSSTLLIFFFLPPEMFVNFYGILIIHRSLSFSDFVFLSFS